LGDKQKDDIEIIKSDFSEVKDRLEDITSASRRTGLFFAALGVGLSLLLVGIVLLAVGGDSVITLEYGEVTMFTTSSLVTFGMIFTIIGLVVVFSSLALAWLWPKLRKQD
jgi:hypothetical protein